jgi:hypothetical protein
MSRSVHRRSLRRLRAVDTLGQMTEPIRFLVTLDGLRDTRQLQQRRLVAAVVSGFVVAGAALSVVGLPGGIALILFGAFLLLEWRFPIIDRWFDRRRLIVGSACEVWLDDPGVQWRQGREQTFNTTGHIDWSRITGLLENDRVLLVMHGRAALVGIPKREVDSAEHLAAFRDEIRERIAKRRGTSAAA